MGAEEGDDPLLPTIPPTPPLSSYTQCDSQQCNTQWDCCGAARGRRRWWMLKYSSNCAPSAICLPISGLSRCISLKPGRSTMKQFVAKQLWDSQIYLFVRAAPAARALRGTRRLDSAGNGHLMTRGAAK